MKNGHPIGVHTKVSKDANKLIEEFMLLANRTVATVIGKPAGHKKPKAFPYRIHDMPDATKLTNLSALARNFGYKVKTSGSSREVNTSINRMLADIKGHSGREPALNPGHTIHGKRPPTP